MERRMEMHRKDQCSYRGSFCLLSALFKGWFIADLFLCELLLLWLEVSYEISWERCRVQWEESGAHLCSRNVERLSAALVQQRVWSTCVISSLPWPAAPVSAAALTPSAVSSSFKNKSTLRSGKLKKKKLIKKKVWRIKRHSSIF